MKVYTKSGDRGTTSLTGGTRVSKADARVEAYGSVDELMANIALLADTLDERNICADVVVNLRLEVSNLMSVAAIISQGGENKLGDFPQERITALEQAIDAVMARLIPVTKFTLPGGDSAQSMCHVCRTVCRRAERRMVAAEPIYELFPNCMAYVNRLSDYLYVVSRNITETLKVEEKYWVF